MYQNEAFYVYLSWTTLFSTSLILYRLPLFVKKLCFSVFVLNSIEDKDSRFISGVQFNLMVPVSFPLRLQEQWFHLSEISYFVLIGAYENFQGHALDIVYFVLFFLNWFEYKHFRYTLDEDLHFILLLSFNVSI